MHVSASGEKEDRKEVILGLSKQRSKPGATLSLRDGGVIVSIKLVRVFSSTSSSLVDIYLGRTTVVAKAIGTL